MSLNLHILVKKKKKNQTSSEIKAAIKSCRQNSPEDSQLSDNLSPLACILCTSPTAFPIQQPALVIKQMVCNLKKEQNSRIAEIIIEIKDGTPQTGYHIESPVLADTA